MLYFGGKKLLQSDRVAVGGDYLPDYMRKSYFSRIRYRAGVRSYGNSYLRMNRTNANPSGDGYDEMEQVSVWG
ncbi:MAG: hypothetical protein V8T12_04055 [Parabacteroides johnsonii]